MPPSQPVPIHIRIDSQEQRSGIPDLLAARPQVHIEVIPLHTGDYDIGGDPCRVIERKTGSDFLCSLEQGRLFPQLATLRKNGFAPILLLEGDPLCASHSQMRPESIRGALTYITAILRVPILPSSEPAESAHLIYAADSPLGSSPVDLYALSCSGATPVPLRKCARDVLWKRPHAAHGTAPTLCA